MRGGLSIYGVQERLYGLLLQAREAVEALQAVLELGLVAAMEGR